jgi:hypothetical protein
MAGQLPSFLTGGSACIRIGDARIAYCQNLSFQSRMDNTAVYGVGSYGPHALEPVLHSVSFSMQITRYTNAVLKGNGSTTPDRTGSAVQHVLPDNMANLATDPQRDGNSLLDAASFNPQLLLLSTTFDIVVYERKANVTGSGNSVVLGGDHGLEGEPLFVIRDCRLGNYGFSFAPGELLIENVSGVGRFLEDAQAAAITV